MIFLWRVIMLIFSPIAGYAHTVFGSVLIVNFSIAWEHFP